MRHSTQETGIGHYGIDTAAVLFFLALEYGREVRVFTADGIMMAITMAMLLVLPYFLRPDQARPGFMSWLLGRTAVGVLGLVFGGIFGVSVGVVFPEFMRGLPLTMLILASMISCYIQFYSLIKLRLVK